MCSLALRDLLTTGVSVQSRRQKRFRLSERDDVHCDGSSITARGLERLRVHSILHSSVPRRNVLGHYIELSLEEDLGRDVEERLERLHWVPQMLFMCLSHDIPSVP